MLSRVVLLPNGMSILWLINGGDPNYLLTGMIHPPKKIMPDSLFAKHGCPLFMWLLCFEQKNNNNNKDKDNNEGPEGRDVLDFFKSNLQNCPENHDYASPLWNRPKTSPYKPLPYYLILFMYTFRISIVSASSWRDVFFILQIKWIFTSNKKSHLWPLKSLGLEEPGGWYGLLLLWKSASWTFVPFFPRFQKTHLPIWSYTSGYQQTWHGIWPTGFEKKPTSVRSNHHPS